MYLGLTFCLELTLLFFSAWEKLRSPSSFYYSTTIKFLTKYPSFSWTCLVQESATPSNSGGVTCSLIKDLDEGKFNGSAQLGLKAPTNN